MQETMAGGTQQYATFRVGGFFFGIEVLKVQEVLRYQEMTSIPLAPAVIEGLINLRGQIVIALDMRRRLSLPPRPPGMEPMSIVARTEDGAVSLLVDEIGDVLELDNTRFDAPPENITAQARDVIQGVYQMEDRLLLVLDTERVVAID